MEREGYRTSWLQEAFLKGKANGEARGEAVGRAKGFRKALLQVLVARGLKLTAQDRKRIDAEADAQRLGSWHAAALTAKSVAEVFADA